MARISHSEQKRIALLRIKKLFLEARTASEARAKRYVVMARKISKKIKVGMPLPERRQFCKKCSSLYVPGKTVRIRRRSGRTVYTCLRCGQIRRILTK